MQGSPSDFYDVKGEIDELKKQLKKQNETIEEIQIRNQMNKLEIEIIKREYKELESLLRIKNLL